MGVTEPKKEMMADHHEFRRYCKDVWVREKPGDIGCTRGEEHYRRYGLQSILQLGGKGKPGCRAITLPKDRRTARGEGRGDEGHLTPRKKNPKRRQRGLISGDES